MTRNGTYNRPAGTPPPPPPKKKKKKRTQPKAQPAADNGPRTPAEQPPQAIAAAQVFHVYELVERILLKLSPNYINNAMLVSDYIRSVAEQSKLLLHHIAGPTPPGLEVIWKVHEKTSIEVIQAPMTIHMALASRYTTPHLEPFSPETPFQTIPLIPNDKLLLPPPPAYIDTGYVIGADGKRWNLSPLGGRPTPHDRQCTLIAFHRLDLAASGWYKHCPRLPGISTLKPECLDMFFTEPPATVLKLSMVLPGTGEYDQDGYPKRWKRGKPMPKRDKSEVFTVVRKEGVRLRDVVGVVEKAGQEWIKQLRSGGGVVKMDGERAVLVSQKVFDSVKTLGSVRLMK